MKLKAILGLAAAALVAFVAVAGATGLFGNGGPTSSSGSSGSADVTGAAIDGPAAAASAAAGATGAGSNGASGNGASGNGAAALGQAGATTARDVVRTAQLAVTAADPTGAAARAGSIATAAGGRVDEDSRNTSAHLVLRVPANRLDATLDQLAALGEETSRDVRGEDVTAQTADLGARVQALQTSVARLQTLVSTSGSLADLLTVETQLTARQADLESLQAQQRALADQVALATVTLDLVAPTVATARADTGPTGFAGAVAGGWHGFTVVVRYLLAALGYALPFLVLGGLAFAVVVGVRRRRARHTPVETPSTG